VAIVLPSGLCESRFAGSVEVICRCMERGRGSGEVTLCFARRLARRVRGVGVIAYPLIVLPGQQDVRLRLPV
jgi:hypothetical protein